MKIDKLDRATALAKYHWLTLSPEAARDLLEEFLEYHFLTLDADELSDYMEDEGLTEHDLRRMVR